MRGLAVALVAAVVTLPACGSQKNEQAGGREAMGTSSQPPVSAKAKASSEPQRPRATSRAPRGTSAAPAVHCGVSRGGELGAGAQLVGVRVGTHDTFDRVTFEFAPSSALLRFGVPSFRIRSVAATTEDPRGWAISLRGSSYAEIVFQNASGVDTTLPSYTPTYAGPKDFTPRFEVLQEAKEAGDYERVLTWAFGLSHQSCWRVLELDNPVRVVVDFRHVQRTAIDLDAREQVLTTFVGGRMKRFLGEADPYLSARVKERYGNSIYIGLSNPHEESYEVLSRHDTDRGSTVFTVRIHEAYTGYGDTRVFRETIEVGPGRNYRGEWREAVVLSDRFTGCDVGC
jgi:hypothetical protein